MEAAFDISHRDEALAIGELKPIVGVSALILLSWGNNVCEEEDENKHDGDDDSRLASLLFIGMSLCMRNLESTPV